MANPNPFGSEAQYDGQFFDSQTEAAWAISLDAAGIAWERESETFKFELYRNGELGATYTYTPDFLLPETETYLEVKNSRIEGEAIIKLLLLSHFTGKVAILGDGKPYNAPLYIFDPSTGNLNERSENAKVNRADLFVPRFKWEAAPEDYPEPIPTLAPHVWEAMSGWSITIDREVRQAAKDHKDALALDPTIFTLGSTS